jgi:hypothetical protein
MKLMILTLEASYSFIGMFKKSFYLEAPYLQTPPHNCRDVQRRPGRGANQ